MERYSMMSSVIVIIFITLVPLAKAANLVPKTCMKISKSNPNNIKLDYCVKALESDPRSKTATFKGLAEISYNLCSNKAKSILTTVNQQLQNGQKYNSAASKKPWETCKKVYKDAEDELKEGIVALKGGDLFKANMRISAALESGTNCADAFIQNKGRMSPIIAKDNTDYLNLTRILLAFTVKL